MIASSDSGPPADLEAERALLGSLMLDPKAREQVPTLRPNHFYADAHQRLALITLELIDAGTPADLVTVAHSLDIRGWVDEIGGLSYIQQIAEAVPNAAHAKYYCDIVRDKAKRRAAQERARNFHERLADPGADTEELLAELSFEDLVDRTESYHRISGAELDGGNFETQYLVPHILAAGQPGGIFGAFKTLKTLIAVDLWISLGTGYKFLNRWPVDSSIVDSRGIPVCLMSGESGLSALQDASRRICRHKGIRLAETDKLILSPDLPRLGQPKHIRQLERFVRDNGIQVLLLDPIYMCLSDVGHDAGNLFLVGEHLANLTALARDTGTTLVIIHHCRKGTNTTFDPAELSDIQWSGFAEWVGQWILLSRRSKYEADGDGKHDLWMNVGGRPGHCGLWAVDITEGRADAPGGRRWEVDIDSASKARATAAADARERRENDKENAKVETARRQADRITKAMQVYPDGETASVICSDAGLNIDLGKKAIAALVLGARVAKCEVQKPNRKKPYPGFKLTQCEPIRHSVNGKQTHCLHDATTTYQTTPLIGGVCLSDRSGGIGEPIESLSAYSDRGFVDDQPF